MSDPLGALSEGATPPYQTSDPSAVAAKEVFRRRLLTTCTQSLIVNPSNDTTTSKPPPPPPPEYAPPSPPRRGTVLGIPGGKAPAGLVASSDGGRNVTSQLIPSKPSSVPKSSYAAAAAAVEQRLLHKSINGQGGGGKDDPHNGSVRSPIPKSMGYRPRQRQPSSSDTSGKQIFFLVVYNISTLINQSVELVKSKISCQCLFFTSYFWHMPLMCSKENLVALATRGIILRHHHCAHTQV